VNSPEDGLVGPKQVEIRRYMNKIEIVTSVGFFIPYVEKMHGTKSLKKTYYCFQFYHLQLTKWCANAGIRLYILMLPEDGYKLESKHVGVVLHSWTCVIINCKENIQY
jgi:hypothetical protein